MLAFARQLPLIDYLSASETGCFHPTGSSRTQTSGEGSPGDVAEEEPERETSDRGVARRDLSVTSQTFIIRADKRRQAEKFPLELGERHIKAGRDN